MVIPAFRARSTIGPIVQAVISQGLPVIVVDDASGDGTAEEAQNAGASCIARSVNGGKGAALRDGFSAALEKDFDWILLMDADGQHLPGEIHRFLEAAAGGSADLVLGNRMENPKRMPFERRLTNRFMSWMLSRIAGQRIPDTQCGFRLIAADALKRIRLVSERFEIDSELAVEAAWAGCRIVSIPVSSVYRRHLSFIQPLRDTFRFLRFLWSLSRERRR